MSAQKFRSGIRILSETGSRALTIDSSGNIKSSVTTDTEVGYLSGVTSSVQTQLSGKIDSSEKGANSGVATLDAGGKIPAAQLPNTVMEFQGTWSAATNSPTLADGAGNAGDVYVNTAVGTVNFGSGNITFAIGDWVIYNGSIWQKSINSNAVVSVNGQQGVVSLDTDSISEGTNKYFTDERAQDAIGASLTDTASVDLTYNDGLNIIKADVLPGGVDHDQLLNYAANKHIDHTTVSISTASNSGLTGGGDISATRSLSVDIDGTTSKSSPVSADELLIYSIADSALRKTTKGQLLSGLPIASTGDINETSFSLSNNQSSPANITSFVFANGSVRSFEALVSVYIDATSPLYEVFTLRGIQKSSSWDLSISSSGDDSQISLSITSAGQVQYTSANISGFNSGVMKFRAITTSV